MRRALLIVLLAVLFSGPIKPPRDAVAINSSQNAVLSQGKPFYWNFTARQSLPPGWTLTRTSSETNGQYNDAAGAGYTAFGNGAPAFTSRGVGVFEGRTNYLLNSDSPVTQTTGSLATGYYVGFCNGTGTVQFAAGTAVGTGFSTVTCSSGYDQFHITTAGTVVATVTGSVNWMDLQGGLASAGGGPTPHIPTASATVTRSADILAIIGPAQQILARTGNVSAIVEAYATSHGYYAALLGGAASGSFVLWSDLSSTGVGVPEIGVTGQSACGSGPSNLTLVTTHRIGGTNKLGNYRISVDGSSPATTSCTDAQTVSSGFTLGSEQGSYVFDGWISQIAIYPYILSNAPLAHKSTVGVPLP